MYTRQQASQLRQAFWTVFGRYMSPVPAADGGKANWINYNTGIKHIYFRMHADAKKATIQVEITHADPALQKAVFEQFLQVKNMLQEQVGEIWDWQLYTTDDAGKPVSTIGTSITNVSILSKKTGQLLFRFLSQD